MMKKMRALLTEEQGQGMTEYGLVLGVLALGVVAVLGLMRDDIVDLFDRAREAISGAGSDATPTTSTTTGG